jgi:DNA polymerase-3 subunit delta'
MREYLTAVAGNAALRQRLGSELEQGSFSHAYILEGPWGSGKATLARELVMALACQHRTDAGYPLPCGQCPTCQKIAAGNCPDVIHVWREKDKATMSVDVVRAMRSDVITVPNDLAFKVYIVHEAHTMTTQAQNALLLTLEEPPSFVLFLLLCEDAGAMLETIRSRAPVLRMQPVPDEEIGAYLLSPARDRKLLNAAASVQEESPDDFAALLRMANGCIGAAISLLDEQDRIPMMEDRHAVTEVCRLLAQRTRPDELMATLLAFGSKRDAVTERIRLLTVALRDLLLLGYQEGASLLFFTNRQSAAELSSRFTARRLLAHIAAAEQTNAALAANGNVRLLLMRLYVSLTQS